VPAEPPLHSPPPLQERRVEIEGKEAAEARQMNAAAASTPLRSQPLPPVTTQPTPLPPPQRPSPPQTYAAAAAAQCSLKQPSIETRPWRGLCRGCKESTIVYETNLGYYCDPCFRNLYSYMKRNEITSFEFYLIADD
jgi:hypothetical protein